MSEEPNMPKVIPAVWISLATAVLGAATAFGAPITSEQSTALMALVGAMVVAIPALDVWLRRARLSYVADLKRSEIASRARNELRQQMAKVDR